MTAALLAASGPAHAVDPSTDIKARISKHADGQFAQAVRVNLDAGDSKNVYIRVKSVVGTNVVVTFTEPTLVSGLHVKYFTIGGKNITADLEDSGYQFTVKPAKARKFRLKLTSESAGIVVCEGFTLNDESGVSEPAVALNKPAAECP